MVRPPAAAEGGCWIVPIDGPAHGSEGTAVRVERLSEAMPLLSSVVNSPMSERRVALLGSQSAIRRPATVFWSL